MRRRRRGRRDYYNEYDSKKVLLAEFRFYNKQINIISEDVIEDIVSRLDKEELIFWTNSSFAENKVGFQFSKETKTIDKKVQTDIYIKMMHFKFKFNQEVLNNAVQIFDDFLFIGFNLKESQTEMLEKIFDSVGYNSDFYKIYEKEEPKLLNDWDSVIELLIKSELLDNYNNIRDFSTFKKIIKDTFDYDIEKLKYIFDSESYYLTEDVSHIMKVFEKRFGETNYRIAIVAKFRYRDPEYSLKVFSDKNKYYTAIDEGAIFFSYINRKFFLDMQINIKEGESFLIPNNTIKSLKNDVANLLTEDEYVINPRIFSFYKERSEKFTKNKTNEILDRISTQYKMLLMDGKTIKINDVFISAIKIEVDDFVMEFNQQFIDVPGRIGTLRDLINNVDMRYNFNELYEKLLKLSCLSIITMDNTQEIKYKKFEKAEFVINNKKIVVIKENNRLKVNGIFCRIDDLFFILSRAVCYENLDDYEKFIKDVSYIGAVWLKMINNSIAIELVNPFYSEFKNVTDKIVEKFYMRFSLFWDIKKRSNIFLMLNGERYLIKYKGKFKKYFDMPYRKMTMSQLKKELDSCIENLDDDQFIQIIENAIEEAKIIKKRGDELVANTLNEINAQKVELEFQGGTHIGYLFKGKKTGGLYFVKESDLSVYKQVDGNWNRRCIVDDSSKQRIFEDRLANRLVNIANEPNYLDRFLAI